LVLSVNVHRTERRLTPFAVAKLLQRALSFTNLATLAKALNSEDTTTLQKIVRLTGLPDEHASLVEWGTRRGSLSMSTAAELMRLGEPEMVRDAIKLAAEENLTKDEARQVVQIRQRSGKSLAECVQQALLTRPKVVRHELILGSLLTDNARSVVSRLGSELVTKKVKLALARRFPDLFAQSVRIDGKRFAIMFAADDATVLRRTIAPDSIETSITRLVEGIDAAPSPIQ